MVSVRSKVCFLVFFLSLLVAIECSGPGTIEQIDDQDKSEQQEVEGLPEEKEEGHLEMNGNDGNDGLVNGFGGKDDDEMGTAMGTAEGIADGEDLAVTNGGDDQLEQSERVDEDTFPETQPETMEQRNPMIDGEEEEQLEAGTRLEGAVDEQDGISETFKPSPRSEESPPVVPEPVQPSVPVVEKHPAPVTHTLPATTHPKIPHTTQQTSAPKPPPAHSTHPASPAPHPPHPHGAPITPHPQGHAVVTPVAKKPKKDKPKHVKSPATTPPQKSKVDSKKNKRKLDQKAKEDEELIKEAVKEGLLSKDKLHDHPKTPEQFAALKKKLDEHKKTKSQKKKTIPNGKKVKASGDVGTKKPLATNKHVSPNGHPK